jgi:RimJ/RimL family protein N-acetyltransferase
MTPEIAEQRRARLRKRAAAARLAAEASAGDCGADGAYVHLRALGPDDIDSMADLFDRLSWRSRYLRFMSPRRVTTQMLRYLADIDHHHHEAVGAFDRQRLVGSAHFFRSPEDPTQAEIAAEVIDPYQGKGIGSCLLHELARLARPIGINNFSATVLAENTAALALLRGSGWPAVTHQDGPVLAITTAIVRP